MVLAWVTVVEGLGVVDSVDIVVGLVVVLLGVEDGGVCGRGVSVGQARVFAVGGQTRKIQAYNLIDKDTYSHIQATQYF